MRICLIGKAPGKEDVPKDAEHKWGLNDLIHYIPDLTTSFEMHDVERDASVAPWMKGEIEALNKAGIPVVTYKKWKELKNCVVFPMDEMHRKYFTNTIAYMIAYAIYKKATKIELYGIQMATPVEFRRQRACCEYWLGYAAGKGIEVYVHRPSQLLYHKEGLYGIEWDNMERGQAYPDALVASNDNALIFHKI